MRFIQQARLGKNDWWRYLGTLVLVFLGWQFFGVIPLFIVAMQKAGSMDEMMMHADNVFVDLGIDSNLYLFCMIFTFFVGLLGLLIGLKFLHKRSLSSLITARPGMDWSRFFFGFGFWLTMSVALMGVDYMMHPDDFVFQLQWKPFLILLVVALFFLPFQTSFEELLFRGYLMQGTALLTSRPWVPLLLTSIVFGLMHGLNPEVEKLGNVVLLYYIGTGLLFGLITILDEGTELALGMHFANNFAAAIFVTMDWTVFQTDALFKDISEPDLSWEMFLPVFVIYPLVLLYFSKKYQWGSWKEKILTKATLNP